MRNAEELEPEVKQCYQELVLSIEIAKRGGTQWFRRQLSRNGRIPRRQDLGSTIWQNGLEQLCNKHGDDVLLKAMSEVLRYFAVHGDMPYVAYSGGGQRPDGSRVPIRIHYVAPPPAV